MKISGRCVRCGAKRLVNDIGLCKRCNRHASEIISLEDRIAMREQALQSAKMSKAAAAAEAEAKEESDEAVEEGEEASGEADNDDAGEVKQE